MITIYHNRQSIRLKGYDYSKDGIYFITICTHNREEILSRIITNNNVGVGLASTLLEKISCKIQLTNVGKIIYNEMLKLENKFDIKIHKYVIMPNHVHMIIELQNCDNRWNINDNVRADTRPAPTLGAVICAFKSKTALKYLKYNKENNIYNQKLWQRNYYEHIIRNKDEYFKICQYIQNNPIKSIQPHFP